MAESRDPGRRSTIENSSSDHAAVEKPGTLRAGADDVKPAPPARRGRLRRWLLVGIEALAAVAALLLLAAGLLFWRLSSGPVELAFLTPYLEAVLSAEPGPEVRIGRTSVGLARGAGTADVVLGDVHIRDREGRPLAVVPDASLSLSLPALLRGVVAPTRIVVREPRLRVTRERDGSFSLGIGADEEGGRDFGPDMLQGLLEPQPGDRPLSHLRRVTVLDAVLTLDDRRTGAVWRAPRAAFSLERTEGGLAGDADLAVEVGGGRDDLHAEFRLSAADRHLDGRATFANWNPAQLAAADPALAPLAALDAPVDGTIAFGLDLPGMRLDDARADLRVGAGHLRSPEFADSQVPVTSVEAQARYDAAGGRLVLERLVAELGGPKLEAHGAVDGLFLDQPAAADRAVVAGLDATATRMPANDLERYWPVALGPAARDWVTRNIRDGTVEEATTSIRLRWPGGAATPKLESMSGRMRVVDATVHYFRPLPPVRGVRAGITFDRATMDIVPTAGTVRAVRVTGGTIHLFNLDTDDERIAIDLPVSGPLRDVLEVIDSKPLGYAKEIGLDPARVKGNADARLGFKFPLKRDLKFDQVEVAVRAQLADVAAEKLIAKQDLSEGSFSLQLDRNAMTLEGGAKLAGIPAAITATHYFKAKDGIRTRYTAWARVDDEGRRRLDLDVLDQRLHGPVGVDVTMTKNVNKRGDALIVLDLRQAELDLAEVNFTKSAGTPGQGRIELELDDERPTRIRDALVTAPGLEARGAFTFSGVPAQLQRAEIRRLVAGETDVSGTVQRRADGGWQVQLQGLALDATRLFDDLGHGAGETQPPLAIDAKLGRLVLGERREARNVSARLESNGLHWQSARVEANLIGRGALSLRLGVAGGERNVTLSTDNMGALLRLADVSENIDGGRLTVTGRAEDVGPRRIYRGRVDGADYRVLNAPVFAKLLSVASFSGIASLLSGEGIPFTRLVGEYATDGSRIELKDARAYGGAIGINASGSVDLDAKTLDLQGTLVPAYTINSILGNIPVLGPLLLGGQGQGLFAANFHLAGSFDDPKISVNPLSALAPGFLRNLFLFDAPDPSRPPPPERKRDPDP